jgi:hypothetical protein
MVQGRLAKIGVLAGTALALLTSATPAAAESVKTARGWLYLSGTVAVQPWLAFTAMPGIRYEVSRSKGESPGYYMNELFLGPTFMHKVGPVTLKLGTWYYYTGYPNTGATKSYYYQHSFELIPIVDYKVGDFTFTSRTIFHNTFYSSIYKPNSDLTSGFGTVLRELIQVKYDVSKPLGIIVADEPFFGLIPDGDTKDLKLNPYGFWKTGYRMNRVYAGVELRPLPGMSVTPQYVFETFNGDDGSVALSSHYLFLTVAYTYKAYETPTPPPPAEAPPAAPAAPAPTEAPAPAAAPAAAPTP